MPMKRLAGVLLLLVAAVSLASCDPGPSNDDKKALSRLEANFGEKFSFEFARDQYVLAYAQNAAPPDFEQGYEIYKQFRASEKNEWAKRTTAYIFMNFYDSKKNFLFQAGPGGITDIEFY